MKPHCYTLSDFWRTHLHSKHEYESLESVCIQRRRHFDQCKPAIKNRNFFSRKVIICPALAQWSLAAINVLCQNDWFAFLFYRENESESSNYFFAAVASDPLVWWHQKRLVACTSRDAAWAIIFNHRGESHYLFRVFGREIIRGRVLKCALQGLTLCQTRNCSKTECTSFLVFVMSNISGKQEPTAMLSWRECDTNCRRYA